MKGQTSSIQYAGIFAGLPVEFQKKALELFHFQYRENALYRLFTDRFHATPVGVKALQQIPFLPVSFFKTDTVKSGNYEPELVFESSGTTQKEAARHYVRKSDLYRESFVKGFEYFYGDPQDYCILGLLPSYLERKGSSLIYMVDHLIRRSGHRLSGFYLYEFEKLYDVLQELETIGQRTLLIGVSFALQDFSERYSMQLNHTLIMETGGMKGRRRELTRIELHEILKKKMGISRVHSEYGMTELLSQAYSKGGGLFIPVPWMKMLVRDEDDPLNLHLSGEGLLNIIDLANRDSCGFIATDDLVKLYDDGSFELLGRMDNSDIRGCSLLLI